MNRRTNRVQRTLVSILSILLVAMLVLVGLKLLDKGDNQVASNHPTPQETQNPDETPDENNSNETSEPSEVKKAKILANGDLLIHVTLYASVYDETTDSFDFNSHYDEVRDFLRSGDLTIGNFEGSISNQYDYGGYPLFNTPSEIVDAIKNAGYDVISLANNHILDSRGEGVVSTYNAFNNAGINTMGVVLSEQDRILVKDVNGIKVALLAYSYGYNGMEETITQEQYDSMLTPLDPVRIKADIEAAKEISDVIVVYPHMGIEYMLEPTQEQVDLFHNMIAWGADIVFGNHPHVIQPTETVQRDGLDKFIIYSMGNFISNQRLETLDNIWTERGVLMEVNISKDGDNPVVIDSVIGHPTWVFKENYDPTRIAFGMVLADYKVLLTENYLDQDHGLDEWTLERIRTAHREVVDHLNINGFQGGQP